MFVLPFITIKSHYLHVGNIRKVMGEITFTMKGTSSLLSLVRTSNIFWPFFGLPFCLPCDGSSHWFLS